MKEILTTFLFKAKSIDVDIAMEKFDAN